MNPFVKPILVVLLLGMLTLGVLFPAVPAHADIYRYTDENGVMHITNLPTSPEYKLWIKERRVIIKAGIDMTKYGPLIQKASDRYKVDYSLVKAVIKAESNFNHKAVSPKGAQGLMHPCPCSLQRGRKGRGQIRRHPPLRGNEGLRQARPGPVQAVQRGAEGRPDGRCVDEARSRFRLALRAGARVAG